MGVVFGPGVKISNGGTLSINLKLQSPNINTATVVSTTSTSVSFSTPCTPGHPRPLSYTVTSSPGCITATGPTSPIVVHGLTSGQSYTFTVTASHLYDTSNASIASPTVTQISVPGAPTIGTATILSTSSVAISFTAPSNNGGSVITSYIATSSPGSKTGTLTQAGSGTITVGGLIKGNVYTFTVQAQNRAGVGPASSASNCVPFIIGSRTFTTPGSYSWMVPAGITTISVVAIGGGAAGGGCGIAGGGGAGLGYKNNIAITTTSYNLVVGTGGIGYSTGQYSWGAGTSGTVSYFGCSCLVKGCGGLNNRHYAQGYGGAGGGFVGDGGGTGGQGGVGSSSLYGGGGGGAGGYCGTGGNGSSGYSLTCATAGTNGAGGGGGNGGGGGVGVFGRGPNGSAGNYTRGYSGGDGGSGGSTGTCAIYSGTIYGGSGGTFGGGGGSQFGNYGIPGSGGNGAVRIAWPGSLRRFPSTCIGVAAEIGAPGIPTITTASLRGLTGAYIAFNPPSCYGGVFTLTYVATSLPGGITGTILTSDSGTIAITGLNSSTSYTFTLTAANIYGTSGVSAPSNTLTTLSSVGSSSTIFTVAGNYSWIAPAGVTSVSVVAVGGGNGGANGYGYYPPQGGDSYFINRCTVKGGGGCIYTAGSFTGGGGGCGGRGCGGGGGGGAGGYTGPGGNGGGGSGAGGGGGGGGRNYCSRARSGGGGVGLYGQGANGAGGHYCIINSRSAIGGGGGSGGTDGHSGYVGYMCYAFNGGGGCFGGGGGCGGGGGGLGWRNSIAVTSGTSYTVVVGAGSPSYSAGGGAVRIVWPGVRQFPSSCVGTP